MSSGNHNYFRHSFAAHRDDKLQAVLDTAGLEGIAVYWIILELCGEQSLDGKEEYIIHEQTIRNVLRKSTQSCHNVLTKLQQCGMFVWTMSEHRYKFCIPNFMKFLGSYRKSPPLIKEKKVNKENKGRLLASSEFDFESLYQKYPKKEGHQKGIKYCLDKIKKQEDYNNLSKAIDNYSNKCKHEQTEKKYMKQFSTFMNCWEDFIDFKIEDDPKIVKINQKELMMESYKQGKYAEGLSEEFKKWIQEHGGLIVGQQKTEYEIKRMIYGE